MMNVANTTEAESFQAFLSREIANGGRHKSPEELLHLWRQEQTELRASVESLQLAIDDMRAGDRGRPLEDVVRDIQREYGWPET